MRLLTLFTSQPTIHLLLSVLLSHGLPEVSAARAKLNLFGAGVQYTARISWAGLQLENSLIQVSNLMLPPKTTGDLCQVESQTGVQTDSSRNTEHGSPVALLVTNGNCTLKQQGEGALLLRQSREPSLRFLIFQSHDTDDPKALPDSNDEELKDQYFDGDNMGFLFVSVDSAMSMLQIISTLETSEASPYLGSPGNELWHLNMTITSCTDHDCDQPADAFLTYLAVVVLLFLLMAIPCFCGCYQWYASGGRVVVGREWGHNMGIELVQPGLLSRSEVLALPELAYHSECSVDGSDLRLCTIEGCMISSSESMIDSAVPAKYLMSTSLQSVSLDSSDKCENPEEPQSDDSDNTRHTTTCTVCSICLQDFEEGERIRLLPSCNHAYHTQCISPWLTQRHGTCPMCKRSVLTRGRRQNKVSSINDRNGASCHDIASLPV